MGAVVTQDEAAGLATQIAQTWRGLPAAAWEDDIVDLDAGTAGTVFVRLRRTLVRAPTIAQFRAEVQAATPRRDDDRPHCERCGSTGWADVVDLRADGTEHHVGCAPCRCPRGRDREAVHRAIVDHNAAELGRLFPSRTERGSVA